MSGNEDLISIQTFDINDAAGMLKTNIRAMGSEVPQSHFAIPHPRKHIPVSPKVNGQGVGYILTTSPWVLSHSSIPQVDQHDSIRGTYSKQVLITLMRSRSGGPYGVEPRARAKHEVAQIKMRNCGCYMGPVAYVLDFPKSVHLDHVRTRLILIAQTCRAGV
ncbi:MAG: hypothetical protein LQ352_003945 [Teloschistes flavicans]|nr:MAG: hypothetical protein LQ352_003945 [Teloschistes flavicans]